MRKRALPKVTNVYESPIGLLCEMCAAAYFAKYGFGVVRISGRGFTY
jgi:hypothetical protein